ncbi:hypothetical protein, partial [Virgibacillus siamensis]|uniref:hypothetical protein n=1 Tax=Virgibacillus siamensis TaxID=480071 RepID=UPI0031DBF449
VSFISFKEDRLKPPLCAATPTYPRCAGTVCTSLNGRFRFCSFPLTSKMRVFLSVSSLKVVSMLDESPA